jgi:hypothetical protein
MCHAFYLSRLLRKNGDASSDERHPQTPHLQGGLAHLPSALGAQRTLDDLIAKADRAAVSVEECTTLLACGRIHTPDLDRHLLACDLAQFVLRKRCFPQKVDPIQVTAAGLGSQVKDLEPRLLQVIAFPGDRLSW